MFSPKYAGIWTVTRRFLWPSAFFWTAGTDLALSIKTIFEFFVVPPSSILPPFCVRCQYWLKAGSHISNGTWHCPVMAWRRMVLRMLVRRLGNRVMCLCKAWRWRGPESQDGWVFVRAEYSASWRRMLLRLRLRKRAGDLFQICKTWRGFQNEFKSCWLVDV